MNNTANTIFDFLHRFGGSPWRFNLAMLKNISKWNEITYLDILDIISRTRECAICHYSLVPFFIKYLGLDIRKIYEGAVAQEKMSEQEYEHILSMFPSFFISIHQESTLEKMGFIELKPVLFGIRQRLIKQGVVSIKSINVKGKNAEYVLEFDKEYNPDGRSTPTKE